jgi:hypothetical protein
VDASKLKQQHTNSFKVLLASTGRSTLSININVDVDVGVCPWNNFIRSHTRHRNPAR